jgi:hypothetical protein
MTRRAFVSPGARSKWSQNFLVALGMGAAVVLLGCGGGGGGGGNNGGGGGGGADACQDNTFSGQTVVCGYVLQDGTTNGVNGATVAVKTSTGTIVKSIKTYHNTATGKDGYYVLPVGNATLIGVAPPASGYFQSYFRFNFTSPQIPTTVYDVNKPVNSGGPCNPPIPNVATPGAGNILPNLSVFPDSGVPPPPVFNCPRQ